MAQLINRLKTRWLHNISRTVCITPPYCNSVPAPCGLPRVSIAKNGRRRRRAGVTGIHKQCGGAAEIGNRYRKWEISHRVWGEMLKGADPKVRNNGSFLWGSHIPHLNKETSTVKQWMRNGCRSPDELKETNISVFLPKTWFILDLVGWSRFWKFANKCT
jgi:hypothetical protein